MNTKDISKIDALIALLDDNDKEVYEHVSSQLISLGKPIIPQLENAWEEAFDHLSQERIEHVIHKIILESHLDLFVKWASTPQNDLMEGLLILNKFHNPDLNEEKLKILVDKLYRDIWIEVNEQMTVIESINVLNQVFYSIYEFEGSAADIGEPEKYYLNSLFDTKTCSPALLSVVYMYMAQQLHLPVYGIDLPYHFILALNKQPILSFNPESDNKPNGVLFYVNPVNGGMILSQHEIQSYMSKMELDIIDTDFHPISNAEVLKLLIVDLIEIYKQNNEIDMMNEVTAFLDIITNQSID